MSQVQCEHKKSQRDAITIASRNLGTRNFGVRGSCLILIADDDRFTRMMLRQLMEVEGYNVEEVADGKQCLAAYEKYKPDLVLLDAMMPVMDGFTCCSQLQRRIGLDSLHDSSTLPIPILMITGLHDQASVDWAFEAGVTDLVTKPIHPPVLLRRVRRLLEASWAEKALREKEKQYHSLVENVKDVVFQTDAAGNWTFLNPAWTELMGFTVEESLGTSFLKSVHPDDQQLHQELWHSLLNNKASYPQTIRYLTKTNECRWIEIQAQPVQVADFQRGVCGILRDVTPQICQQALEQEKLKLETEIVERKIIEDVIRDALLKEKKLAELQSQIITTLSHEFCVPLTRIQLPNLSQRHSQQWLEAQTLEQFQQFKDAFAHISQVLDDVSLIGQAEAEQLKLNPTQINLENYCQDVVKDWQRDIGAKVAPKLIFSVQGDATEANLDETLLRQILTELLSNAVKFSLPAGSVQFSLECQEGQAIFRVRDQGIGIPQEEQERVFESFYRAGNIGAIPGRGLGLAIAKRCVDLHQGQITVDSEVGVGSVFTVTLPLNQKQTSREF